MKFDHGKLKQLTDKTTKETQSKNKVNMWIDRIRKYMKDRTITLEKLED